MEVTLTEYDEAILVKIIGSIDGLSAGHRQNRKSAVFEPRPSVTVWLFVMPSVAASTV